MHPTFSLLFALTLAGCAASYEPQTRRNPMDTFAVLDTADPGSDTGRDTEADTEPDTEPDTDPDTTPVPGETLACYLGPNRNNAQCVDTVAPSNMPSGYDYPAALNGSAQYREPVRWLDLAVVDPDLQIAPNFVLSEIAEEYKGRYAVVQPHAIASLQAVRDQLGALVINSGYRPPDYNAGVGGVSSSRHIYGDGFDIDPVNATLAQLDAACDAQGAGYVGVYTTHIHCDWRNDAVSVVFYGAGRRSYLPVLPELNAIVAWRGGELAAPAVGWDEGEPLREWSAYDRRGELLERVRSDTYLPPARAARVEVEVGRRLFRAIEL